MRSAEIGVKLLSVAAIALAGIVLSGDSSAAEQSEVVELLEDPAKAVTQVFPPDIVTELILDASGSMKAKVQSRTKLFQAKRVLRSFMIQARNDRMNLGLRVYGQKEKDCKDSQLMLKFNETSEDSIDAALEKIDPKGYGKTPLDHSLREAAKDFDKFPGKPKRIIVVTDGIESCGGDPCATARELKKKHDVRIFVVAYSTDDKARQQLSCLAQETDGTIQDADDLMSLHKALGDLSDLNKNLFVKSPDPMGLSFVYERDSKGRRRKVGEFVSSLGYKLPLDREFEVDVQLDPPFRFASVRVSKGQKKTLLVTGNGTVEIRYGGQLFSITLLNEEGRALQSFASDVPTKIKTGIYKLKAASPPFAEVIIDDVMVVPNGKYIEDIKGFGTLQVDTRPEVGAGPFGMFVFDDQAKRDIGSYLTGFPLVLPFGRYTLKSIGNAVLKDVYPEENRVLKVMLPPPGQVVSMGRQKVGVTGPTSESKPKPGS